MLGSVEPHMPMPTFPVNGAFDLDPRTEFAYRLDVAADPVDHGRA
jgi:hypothetical protein